MSARSRAAASPRARPRSSKRLAQVISAAKRSSLHPSASHAPTAPPSVRSSRPVSAPSSDGSGPDKLLCPSLRCFSRLAYSGMSLVSGTPQLMWPSCGGMVPEIEELIRAGHTDCRMPPVLAMGGCTVSSAAGGGLLLEDGAGGALEDCTLRDVAEAGLTVADARDVRVARCVVHDCGGAGLLLYGGRGHQVVEDCGVRRCMIQTRNLLNPRARPADQEIDPPHLAARCAAARCRASR